MNKRKIFTLALAVMMIAILAIGGSLAYLTDTENAVNVFTVGNIEIDLVERQRNDAGTALEEFEDDKLLMPIVGSAQGAKETIEDVNLPTRAAAANWVDKIVTVDNEGTQPAYVRVLLAFPADLDDANSAAEMMLHWNHDGAEAAGLWKRSDVGVAVEVDGRDYNVYNYTYVPVLAAKKTTASPAIIGVYLDSRVDATQKIVENEDGTSTTYVTYTMGNKTSIAYPTDNGPKILVVAQGVQEAGFGSADAALNEAFGVVSETNAQAWFNEAYANANDETGDDRADYGVETDTTNN